MPLFGGKKKNKEITHPCDPRPQNIPATASDASDPERNVAQEVVKPPPTPPVNRPKLQFHCQLAHGSPTGIIEGFTNVRELYQKIAASFDLDVSDILFCTLNSFKLDMSKLLAGQLGLDDFIFVHIKGRPKVVDIEKSASALGLTITDNGAGYAFIKSIKESSTIGEIEGICIGDHIEKINNVSMVGLRHFEVAKVLKDIPQGTTFTLRVVEPLKSGFSEIGVKSSGSSAKKKSAYGSGKETLRLRSKGSATVEVPDDTVNLAIEKINTLLENFLGINDTELAQTIWETGNEKSNPSDFALSLDESELQDFGFTDAFIFDLWGAISDAKQGRLKKVQAFDEKF